VAAGCGSADRDRLDEEMARLKSDLHREQAWAHADDDDELRCVAGVSWGYSAL
jgi:hypothetical protein